MCHDAPPLVLTKLCCVVFQNVQTWLWIYFGHHERFVHYDQMIALSSPVTISMSSNSQCWCCWWWDRQHTSWVCKSGIICEPRSPCSACIGLDLNHLHRISGFQLLQCMCYHLPCCILHILHVDRIGGRMFHVSVPEASELTQTACNSFKFMDGVSPCFSLFSLQWDYLFGIQNIHYSRHVPIHESIRTSRRATSSDCSCQQLWFKMWLSCQTLSPQRIVSFMLQPDHIWEYMGTCFSYLYTIFFMQDLYIYYIYYIHIIKCPSCYTKSYPFWSLSFLLVMRYRDREVWSTEFHLRSTWIWGMNIMRRWISSTSTIFRIGYVGRYSM